MLNIGGWELGVILLVALVVLGPTRLPEVARQVGQTVSQLRSIAKGFQTELEAAARPDSLIANAPNADGIVADPFDLKSKAASKDVAAEAAQADINGTSAEMSQALSPLNTRDRSDEEE